MKSPKLNKKAPKGFMKLNDSSLESPTKTAKNESQHSMPFEQVDQIDEI